MLNWILKSRRTTLAKTPKRVNYLNNRDILKEIHKSKSTFCSFIDPERDHQFDIILESVDRINLRTVAEARRLRAARITKETGETVDEKSIPNTDLVFRVMTNEHLPLVPKKKSKKKTETKKSNDLSDLLNLDDDDVDNDEAVDPNAEMVPMRVNFPAFFHYRIDEDRNPYIVGKSHWEGGMENGHFSNTHGKTTNKLAMMYMKLCERYATRSNWRGYTYNEEMRGQALLQLAQIGLQFDESKSANPFAYYTAAITNSFTRVLNIEKKNQNIRDDLLEEAGLNPSWTRQNADYYKKLEHKK